MSYHNTITKFAVHLKFKQRGQSTVVWKETNLILETGISIGFSGLCFSQHS